MPQEPTLPDTLASAALGMLARHPGLVALFDASDRLLWANAAWRSALQVPDGAHPTWAELMRANHAQGVGAAIDTDDFERWLASAGSRRGKQPYRQFETDLRDGRWMLMTETMDERGWMLCIASDVSDLASDHRALRVARDLALRASQVDVLTGIGNRAFVLQRLGEALAAPAQPPCVALIDLDHFKQVNDRWGHAAGDTVLREFAQLLQDGLRRADACGRIGGEEFLVVLNDIPLQGAEEVVLRLLAQVRAARPLPAEPGYSYTASVGLVQAHTSERAEDVMARADVAVYRAKRAGRDRCVLGA
jgi:diguanylate cyclase (GGDEF)-like protein